MNLYNSLLDNDSIKKQYGVRWRKFCLDFDIWNLNIDLEKEADFQWTEVKFKKENRILIPESKGIYFFLIKPTNSALLNESHKYILYIGQAKNLRRRYGEYFRYASSKHASEQLKRYMVVIWRSHLYFNFIELLSTNDDELTDIEYKLIDSIAPPFNKDFRSDFVKERMSLISRR